MQPRRSKIEVRKVREQIVRDLEEGYTYAEIWRRHFRDAGLSTGYRGFFRRCQIEGLTDPHKPSAEAPTAAQRTPKEKIERDVDPTEPMVTGLSMATIPPTDLSGFKPLNNTLDGLSPNEALRLDMERSRAKLAAMAAEEKKAPALEPEFKPLNSTLSGLSPNEYMRQKMERSRAKLAAMEAEENKLKSNNN